MRYSASRGIRYSAPPGPEGDRTDDRSEDEAAAGPTAADPEAGAEAEAPADDD